MSSLEDKKVCVVVTAANEQQAEACRLELSARPRLRAFEAIAVADPAGRRIGSGGGTLNALQAAARHLGGDVGRHLVVVVHSGGDAQRCPCQSVCGKAWAALPCNGRVAAPFDLLVDQLLVLCEGAVGLVVACSDVLLHLPSLPPLKGAGVAGLAVAADAATYGPRHGVYVADASGKCERVLQKASLEALTRAGAVAADGTCGLDSGVVFFDGPSTEALLGLADGPWRAVCDSSAGVERLRFLDGRPENSPEEGEYSREGTHNHARPKKEKSSAWIFWTSVERKHTTYTPRLRGATTHSGDAPGLRVELYTDLLCALDGGGFDDYAAYAAMPADEKDPARVEAFRSEIWRALRATPLRVVRPAGAAFAHLGTTRELVAMLTEPSPFRESLRLGPRAAAAAPAGAAPPAGGAWGVCLNSVVRKPGTQTWAPLSVVEHSVLESFDVVGRGCVVSGVRALPAGFRVPDGWLLQQTKLVGGGFACAVLGTDDDVKSASTFLGRPWAFEDVWDAGDSKALWAAKLFPVAATAEEATAASAALVDGPTAAWRAAERVSLRDILRRGDKVAEFAWKRDVAGRVKRAGTCTATAPARVDLSGGWSDTAPICHEHGGRVANCAVLLDGQRPLGAKATPLLEPELVFSIEGADEVRVASLDDLEDRRDPRAPAALLKCAAVVCGAIDMKGPSLTEQLAAGGLRVESWSRVPTGSGLGTSSILAACLVAAIKGALDPDYSLDRAAVVLDALEVEEELTTRGGWQDQVGGVYGGFKLGSSPLGLPVRVETAPIRAARCLLDGRLVLIYTGTARLAKDILERVVAGWRARAPGVVETVAGLVAGAERCAEALEAGDVEGVGRALDAYWELKKRMAAGAEPDSVRDIIAAVRGRVHGAALCGAGGGGFLAVITKERDDLAGLKKALGGLAAGVTLHPAVVDGEGLRLRREGPNVARNCPSAIEGAAPDRDAWRVLPGIMSLFGF